MTIQLNEPLKPDLKKLNKYLEEINSNGWFTNFGPMHERLTSELEKYLGVENLLLVSNGTLALQVAYKVFNVKKALTTPFSFVATSSSLLWEGIELLYTDINKDSLNLDSRLARKQLDNKINIDTIVPTHVFGNPCDVEAYEKISQDYGVKIIYDAAHAFGVKVGDKSILTFGDASILSFHATKLFHTIEGGAIVFKRKSDLLKAKKLISFGINESAIIDSVGINAKMNEYQSAVGLVNLENIQNVIEHRTELFNVYRNSLSSYLQIPIWLSDSSYNGSYMPVLFLDRKAKNRAKDLLDLEEIQTRNYFSPSLDDIFDVSVSEELDHSHDAVERILCLPLHYYLTEKDVEKIINIIISAVKS